MKEYIYDLSKTNLFYDIEPSTINSLIRCIGARCVGYKKGEVIVREGSRVYDFGIILSGSGRAIKEDAEGKLIIITMLKKGSEIGAILAASLDHKSPVSVQMLEDSTVLVIPFNRIITRCKKACPQHDLLLRNYINIVAEKGLVLHERIDCLLKTTVRKKILTYLIRISREKENQTFDIPFDRNGMAEYLNIERSALSRELSKMKKEGLIDFHKNRFKLFL